MDEIKSYSDLKQSKVLSKILSDESADMSWVSNGLGKPFARTIPIKGDPEELCGCWSLSALLSVLPLHLIVNNQRYAFSMIKGLDKNGETYAIKYAIFNTTFYFHLTDAYDNPVDACYEIILKLNELNLL